MSAEKQDESEAFLCEVCWHYFVNELTQAEVARLLGVTRLRVNQAISQAKASGLVRVEITSPFLACTQMQRDLCELYDLNAAFVVPGNTETYDYHLPTGTALATYLTDQLKRKNWKSIGVSWGATLQCAIRKLPKMALTDLEIISMIGGTTHGGSFNAFSIASGFAERLGATYSLFAAPIYLSHGASRTDFLAQDIYADHMRKLSSLDAAVLVAGDISEKSYMVSTGLPADVSTDVLLAEGAVGDVLGRFLDRDGNDIPHPLNQRTIGIDLEALKQVPEIILAAAGPHKLDIIRAAIRRGLVHVLITDDVTARLLLEEQT
ncbi:transcriptional regulator [Rhodobacterales bacterium]|nr:transcriptional regulator [Rhodobacterales bacterium]